MNLLLPHGNPVMDPSEAVHRERCKTKGVVEKS